MEELIRDKRKKIIARLVSELARENMDLYYTDSMTVSSLVVEKIAQKKLPKQDYDLVKDFSARDIQILLSYNSSCC
ncbi:MAG: hypothetical protein CME62_06240 [Halobacteriovoraceae bacterium]|nr:hypothetical protein [Halobacteriovoraceae bacterium]|tara:strand:- start:4336 stop:4563 length:228 start_codon:yes stop_codon:yes gene_type:complete